VLMFANHIEPVSFDQFKLFVLRTL
jgi:hypothetical protein